MCSLLKRGLIVERLATSTDTVWREDGDQRLALSITAAGLEAIGIDTAEAPLSVPEDQKQAIEEKRTPRRGSAKVETVLALLRRPDGASIADMNRVTNWQAHTIRAFLSGLRKKGTEVARTKDSDGKAIYRIDSKSPATEQAN